MTIAPYGTWKSPLTAEAIVGGSIALSQPRTDGDSLYWIEGRPTEGGRSVLVRRNQDGSVEDVIEAPLNARNRVHEYGGGDYVVDNGRAFFTNFADQRVYTAGTGPTAALTGATGTPDPDGLLQSRYADYMIDRTRNRLVCVRERHFEGREPENDIAAIDIETGEETTLTDGHDFYAYPRLSPDGSQLAWIAWDHPNMPWDATLLYVAAVNVDHSLDEATVVAGGPEESVLQPAWSQDGRLHFISDRSGFWNLYRVEENGQATPLCPMPNDFGQPLWQLGTTTYGFDAQGRIVTLYNVGGRVRLGVLDAAVGVLRELDTPIVTAGSIHVAATKAYLTAGFADRPGALVEVDFEPGAFEVVRSASTLTLDEGYVSVAQPIQFPTANGLTAHAFFYPPRNADYEAPSGELPPLLVMSHGGPTGATGAALSPRVQYWTTRGVAVLDVNYGGSTGYGRAYRQRLNGKWGIVDVEDCVNAALYMAAQGLVDRDRIAITGGSAGGYTTLAALTFHDVFKAGASHYGIGDLEALARDTHKFESRYLDNLVGPYPSERETYVKRSPIHHTDKLSCPVIFFQGLEDKVVPPNQAQAMVEALRSRGVPVSYFPFEGEQHGFRQATNIKRALEAELAFYGRIFGFQPADHVDPFEIYNIED